MYIKQELKLFIDMNLETIIFYVYKQIESWGITFMQQQ